MPKSTIVLLTFVIILSMLIGVVGGGVMGAVAGYYAARSSTAAISAEMASFRAPSLQPVSAVGSLKGSDQVVSLKEDSAIIDAVRTAKPAVVTVINTMQARRSFFGNALTPTSSGSGVIIDAKGYIITNNHVIEGQQSLQVIFSDGTKANATLLGTDSVVDIAVIKVDGKVPAVAQFGDSNSLVPGQAAIAIGSPLGEYRGTVTVGIISAVNRQVGQQQGLIQTDAAINNGNSGGPLLNSMGQVIGINTLVVRSTNSGNVAEGLGFAIPSNLVRDIANQLITTGSVVHPYLGVNYQQVDPQIAGALNLSTDEGIVVTSVIRGSPAARAGLQQGDVIVAIDGNKLTQENPLSVVVNKYKVGDTVTLSVLRDTQSLQVKLQLVARPASQ